MKVQLLRDIARPSFMRKGLTCARLFRVDPAFFARLRDECMRLDAKETAPARKEGRPITNWVGHYGMTTQVQLDRAVKRRGKEALPTIAELIAAFADLEKMKLNGITPGSGIPAHKEPVLVAQAGGYSVRARFHLPLITNPGCEMRLNDEIFHFDEGVIYFFNKGAVHGAWNNGDKDRHHIVFDLRMTQASYDLMFGDGTPPWFLTRATDRSVTPLRKEPLPAYKSSGDAMDLYKKWKLERYGVGAQRFCRGWDFFAGLKPRNITFAASRSSSR